MEPKLQSENLCSHVQTVEDKVSEDEKLLVVFLPFADLHNITANRDLEYLLSVAAVCKAERRTLLVPFHTDSRI